MTRLSYPVKEAFLTMQGEGAHAGARAVFVRFAGCNVWSGREEDRARDVVKGCCAAWCDTDFVGTNGQNGGSYSAEQLVRLATDLGADADTFVVFTGGEPTLLLDSGLVRLFHDAGVRVHVETNGSRHPPDNVDWVTLAPKPPMPVVVKRVSEIKVVYPAIDPLAYAEGFESRHAFADVRRYVQPLDSKDEATNRANVSCAAAFVMSHRGWRLSLQTHKIVGVP